MADDIQVGDYVEIGSYQGDSGPWWYDASSKGRISLPIGAVVRVEAIGDVSSFINTFAIHHPDADLKEKNLVHVMKSRCKKVPKPDTVRCKCAITVLMSTGCVCGGQ